MSAGKAIKVAHDINMTKIAIGLNVAGRKVVGKGKTTIWKS